MKRILFCLGIISLTMFAIVLFFLHPSVKKYRYNDSFIIRVRIAKPVASVDISSRGSCDLKKPSTGEILVRGMDLRKKIRVIAREGKIDIGQRDLNENAVRISPRNASGFCFNGTEYRGELDITANGELIEAVNRVGLEDYLKGVVPREVYHFWPMSALKAQAVASRSYAVFEASRRKKRDYDLTSDTFTQVYGGRSAERLRTTSAVEATRGKVLVYEDKFIPGYFHASCGGHTASISKVWNGPDSEPFQGVRSNYCRWSPSFRWRARVPTKIILEKLNNSGYGFDRIDDIRIGKRDTSGRLEYLRIRSRNKWFEIPIGDFMKAIGATTLKSSNFRVRKYPVFYDFDGYGWGHGVGMCQWCAFGLSLRGWDYERILEYFYPGAKVALRVSQGI